ncbi:Tryptophan--tRNA ligase, mitochondrial [Erysiphe necator]|nr:Tryptophan--tRNA ligase, mitochondrial [Erysiphe necator]
MFHFSNLSDRWLVVTRKFQVRRFSTKFSKFFSHKSSLTTETPHNAKIIFSAIQPTGIPHLGNYLGAMINWVKLQESENNDTKLIFSVADLHARESVADIF